MPKLSKLGYLENPLELSLYPSIYQENCIAKNNGVPPHHTFLKDMVIGGLSNDSDHDHMGLKAEKGNGKTLGSLCEFLESLNFMP